MKEPTGQQVGEMLHGKFLKSFEESITRGTEIRQLREANVRLRNKLLELAKECAECGGSGVVVLSRALVAVDAGSAGDKLTDCPQCADIRELLL